MAKKHMTDRKCMQIHELLEENKFTKALELMDTLNLSEVSSLSDLYLFADLYEKAERMDKKRDIYYMIFERTHSRHVLNRLLRLMLRLGDTEEARELFFAYEVVNGITLDTYELRYLIAKAEGEPRSRLIEILEDLKKEEYTEEWGFQLARLYEQEGLRDECIRECKDLKLWFGEGSIVEKAEQLRKRCEAIDWQPPVDEEIPEPEKPEEEEVVTYAAPPVEVEELETLLPKKEEEPVLELEVPEMPKVPEEKEPVLEEEKPEVHISMGTSYESVSEPVVVKKNPAAQTPIKRPVQDMEEWEADKAEDISERGIAYRTLKATIQCVKRGQGAPHFVFAGGEERITLAVAKRMIKELNYVGHSSAKSIVKITAEKLNQLELSEQKEKLLGGCVLITAAPDMSKKTVYDLLRLLEENGDQLVVMLAGPYDELDCFLANYPELSEKLEQKVRM